jgi:drug/metabolite transporter (DMT)-like permease
VAALTYAVCALVWGTTWFVIRICIGPGGFPPLTAAALRFSIASVLLIGLWAVGIARPGPRTRAELGWMVVAGAFNATSYALIYRAETEISGGLAAVLFGTFPLVVALLAVVTRTERVRTQAVLGSLVSIVGIALLFRERLGVSAAQAWAVAMTLCAVVASGVYSVIIKRVASRQHPLAATGWFLSTTALGLWLGVLVVGEPAVGWPPAVRPTAALLYLGVVGSVIVYAAYFSLIRRVSLMTVTTLVFIQPMIALVVDAVWEHQVTLGAGAYLGGGIILAGVAVSVLVRSWPRPAE